MNINNVKLEEKNNILAEISSLQERLVQVNGSITSDIKEEKKELTEKEKELLEESRAFDTALNHIQDKPAAIHIEKSAEGWIVMTMSFNKGLKELFKSHVKNPIGKGCAYDKDEKKWNIVYNKNNVRHIVSFLEVAQKEFSDLDLVNLLENVKDDSFSLEELQNEVRQRKTTELPSNIKSIFDQDRATEQTIEDHMYNCFIDRILINKATLQPHVYEVVSGVWVKGNERRLASFIAQEISMQGLYGYRKDSVYTSCAKTIMTSIDIVESKKVVFNKKYFAVRVVDEKSGEFYVHMRTAIVNDTVQLKVEKPKRENFCYTKYNVVIDSAKIKDFDYKRFINGQEYIYTPTKFESKDVEKDQTISLFNYYIQRTGHTPAHTKMIQLMLGSFLSATSYQKIAVLYGSGGEGKGQLFDLLFNLYEDDADSFDISTDYDFAMQEVIGKRLLLTPEVKSSIINEVALKQISGDDRMKVFVKQKGGQNLHTNDINVIISMNSVWKSQDQQDSITRRFVFIHLSKKDDHIIQEISQKIINGGIWKDQNDKLHESESSFNEFFDFTLEGLLEVEKSQGACLKMQNFDADVAEFNKKIFGQMIATKDFFEEFEIKHSETVGISKDDLFELFNVYANKNGYKSVGKNKFTNNFEAEFMSRFKIDISKDIRGLDSKGKSARCYPICVSEEYAGVNKYMLRVKHNAEKNKTNVSSIDEAKQKKLNTLLEPKNEGVKMTEEIDISDVFKS